MANVVVRDDALLFAHVAVDFNAVKPMKKSDKTYLTMNATKDQLKAAPGFKYDREKTAWVPDNNAK